MLHTPLSGLPVRMCAAWPGAEACVAPMVTAYLEKGSRGIWRNQAFPVLPPLAP
ncbi:MULTISPECIES: hypothetical protein [Streptomyces]|uniref:hypothetical protein n=1 Tax=Streptomyces TaxID=1883 RepID=UPI00136B808B|nr:MULTISPECIES: hypothetical protein [Streptomyces]NEA01880.1 hypothetical protein [Streptomyces sp. SID10116]MYY85346.1 hypothetical protein [Streptomyces sp. SID335]MYZ19462.1 hypothetical protein [Streptomyces sp. SID337]NDZ86396.1 hypothetical protein [Streptomyces sp. SID10115]NEB43225.1 hypothetical protein [Streptomyces sp. SID339]